MLLYYFLYAGLNVKKFVDSENLVLFVQRPCWMGFKLNWKVKLFLFLMLLASSTILKNMVVSVNISEQ